MKMEKEREAMLHKMDFEELLQLHIYMDAVLREGAEAVKDADS